MEIVFGILFLLLAAGVVYWLTARDTTKTPAVQTPEDLVIDPAWKRLTIRSERANTPDKPWNNVRVQASMGDKVVQDWTLPQWSSAQMQAFEDRLIEAGWSRHAQGSSEQLPQGFDRLDRFVIFTR